jgi:hypothetical protein
VIFMWGRGREGQLGTGLHSDCALPTAVDELRGRRVVQVLLHLTLCCHQCPPSMCFLRTFCSQPALALLGTYTRRALCSLHMSMGSRWDLE